MAAELGLDGFVDLGVGGLGCRQLDAQAAVAGHGDLGAHLARGVEPDRALLLAADVISTSGVAMRSMSCSRTALAR